MSNYAERLMNPKPKKGQLKILVSVKLPKEFKTKADFNSVKIGEAVQIASTGECWVGIKKPTGTTSAQVIETTKSEDAFLDLYKMYMKKHWKGILKDKDIIKEGRKLLALANKYPVGTIMLLRKGRLTIHPKKSIRRLKSKGSQEEEREEEVEDIPEEE